MGYAVQLLADILVAQGLDPERAVRTAEQAMAAQVAAGLVAAKTIELVDRDARIYHLRGQRVSTVALADRFAMNRSNVFEAIRRHQSRRRMVLRLVG